jgi:hypothetical protein
MLLQLLFGLTNPPGVLQRQPPTAFYVYDTYVKELEAMLVRRNLEILKAYNRRHCDQCVHVSKFKIGEQVLVKDESVRRG